MKKFRLDFRLILICIIGIGLGIRIATIWMMEASSDAYVYFYMGKSFLQNGEFVMQYGDYSGYNTVYSHHFPPLYPMYLSGFIALFGYNVFTMKLAGVISGLLPIIAGYWATKDLYGKDKALCMAALLSVEPASAAMGGIAFSENLVNFFFILTIWAILKSLKEERYILWAGLFAGLGYLTKSSMGWFFIIAGIVGFAWRFYYVRWRVFKDKYYIAAIAIFLGIFSIWAVRNLVRFWDGSFYGLFTQWQTSAYTAKAIDRAFKQPMDLLYILAVRIPFFAFFFLISAMFWLKEIKNTRKLEEENSALLLAVVLVYLLSWLLSSIFWVLERHTLFWPLHVRYIIPSIVPLFWLVFKQHEFDSKKFRIKLSATLSVAIVLMLILCTPLIYTQEKAEVSALEDLRDMVSPGDTIYIRGIHAYEVYLYLYDKGVDIVISPHHNETFILTAYLNENFTVRGYHLVKAYRATRDPLMTSWSCAIWERDYS